MPKNNRNVLITGGSSGLGKLLAEEYCAQGATVTILDVVAPTQKGVSFVKCDLSQFNEKCTKKMNSFDVVICNAGISLVGKFEDQDIAQERTMYEINVLGHIQLIRTLLKKDLINDSARLGFISSGTTVLPFPIAITYASTKSALDGFAHALEPYVRERRISVTRVFPGPMNTPHQKYYEGYAKGKALDPRTVVKPILCGLEKRRRKVYPDRISKALRIAHFLLPGVLVRKMYEQYRKLLF